MLASRANELNENKETSEIEIKREKMKNPYRQ